MSALKGVGGGWVPNIFFEINVMLYMNKLAQLNVKKRWHIA